MQLKLKIRYLVRWLKDHAPVLCGCCAKVFFAKDACYEISNLGVEVCLCPKCHAELFHPFTGGEP